MGNPNESDDECKADNESHIHRCSGIKASETPEHRIASPTPNVLGLIRPTRKSMKYPENQLDTVSAMETRRNKGHKKK
jgi:hypothetical protein